MDEQSFLMANEKINKNTQNIETLFDRVRTAELSTKDDTQITNEKINKAELKFMNTIDQLKTQFHNSEKKIIEAVNKPLRWMITVMGAFAITTAMGLLVVGVKWLIK